VRPIRLELQGLTAYKDKVEIDFSDLDLFAITGPTGAGKSSLVDAITYALFGEVPRVGDSIKQLITHGEDRLRVNLEFSAGGVRYRVHRSTGHKGLPSVQLEHLDPTTGQWLPDADKAKDVNERVTSILGMDYDGFVRSILLPQGQFQQFLAGKPEERRKVLDSLLRLDVYQAMQQQANTLAQTHGQEAERIRQRLQTELAGATPENLEATRRELAGLERQAEAQRATREALESAYRAAESMNEARGREADARRGAEKARKDAHEARQLLQTGEEQIKQIEAHLTSVQEQVKQLSYDPDLHVRLTRCQALLDEVNNAAEHEARLDGQISSLAATLDAQVEKAAKLEAAHKEARRKTADAEAAFDHAREGNAAALLQSRLKPGDTCPVCGGAVGHIEVHHQVAELDKLRAALDAAREQERAADKAAREARDAVMRSQQALDSLKDQLRQRTDERQRRMSQLEGLLPEPGLSLADVEARIQALDSARQRIEALKEEERQLSEQRNRRVSDIAGAQKVVAQREAEADAREREAETASKQAAQAEQHLRRDAGSHRWDDVVAALDADGDVPAVLQSRLSSAREQEREINRQIGACQTRIQAIQKDIETATALSDQEKEHSREASLARDLASLLRVTAFPNYIRESALRLLAQDGSRHLMDISRNRYEFTVDGQEFLVVDHWNVDETRSVKTLSGGETFLASLALALALAEHLPGLGAASGAHSLESLFIDEGFSNLDADTLDIVANALETIGQGGNRMVGVITHLPALAERMPARITVHKSQTGSTISCE